MRKSGKDPLIAVLEKNVKPLKLFCVVWQLLYQIYSDGRASPDIGKLREQLFIHMLRKEYGLKVYEHASTEREADITIYFNDETKKTYSIKSKEVKMTKKSLSITGTVKVAWDNFPTEDRIAAFTFHYDILLLLGSKEAHKLFIVVLDVDTLNTMKKEKGYRRFFTIPRSDRNPRGFGIKGLVTKELVEKAKEQGNFISVECPPLSEREKQFRDTYLDRVYEIFFEKAKEVCMKSSLNFKIAKEDL